jgi:hypothetical protein
MRAARRWRGVGVFPTAGEKPLVFAPGAMTSSAKSRKRNDQISSRDITAGWMAAVVFSFGVVSGEVVLALLFLGGHRGSVRGQ